MRAFLVVYAVTAWAFLIGLLSQVFLIGLYLFSHPGALDANALDAHRSLGWILHLSPLLVLLFAYPARAGREHWQWALGLAVVVLIVPILATLHETAPVAAALHPVGAVIAVVLAAVVAWNSLRALRLGSGPMAAPSR